ncbi:universal stress protein [Aphanothece sacrum]|uniref:UspA domain-containing protein n=1 Tax=Aphanothece sacrum FPU1 TaxID=1920663 RepID=A0A401IFL5_APHSA|nr:universal stress protein [Aphanothece sacrum]GBF79970.1 hypothetical protein AsFPU1_1370 [Aphanothece sacrum FPU1]GBF83810.1 universal stress protein [Aphanothece sacrum FPU3]
MSYKRIFVALDKSPFGQVIFEKAVSLAKQNEAALMLFHSLPIENRTIPPYASVYEGELADFSYLIRQQIETETETVKEWLSNYCTLANEQGVATEYDWKIGEPGRWIRDIAKNWNADLIIVGRRGLTGISEMFLGSVSNYIVHHAHCSILIIQGIEIEEEPGEKV